MKIKINTTLPSFFFVMALLIYTPPLPAVTARTSFDWGWTFERFGKMPDGSVRPEPGRPASPVQASSTEAGRPADLAIDGNPETRWCASSGAADQWLMLDLGGVARLGGVRIDWEQPSQNPYDVEISLDGTTWQTAVTRRPVGARQSTLPFQAAARYIRVNSDGSTANWVSIRELQALDVNGGVITPRNPDPAARPLRPQDPDFDTSAWRSVNLPHDWAVEGPFMMSIENETGKLPWEGIGWYRKTFEVRAELADRRLFLDFDGAMAQAKVYINGALAGEWAYGYNSFRVDITPHVRLGEENVVAVRLENLPQSTRWYPGAGIYRHVYFTHAPRAGIAHWGVYVTTPTITDQAALVRVETTLENSTADAMTFEVQEEVLFAGEVVASIRNPAPVPAGGSSVVTASLKVPDPQRWDMDTPNLYTLRTRVFAGSEIVDERLTTFGIREIAWDAEQGFLLNGRKVILQGVCMHHDLGALGSAVHRRALERQIEILQEMGVNAIRTAHNPPAPEFLELCDRMGMLVIDELFDIWKLQKYGKSNGYNIFWDEWHEKDVRNFMLRDRNHPSIIAWSTGNEVAELGRADMHWVPARLRELMRQYDTTRPVTAGSNNPAAASNGFQRTVDVYGVNYHLGSYAATEQSIPDKALYSSESSSTVSTRGEYFFPVSWDKSKGFYDFQVSSYDLYAPGWANRPDLQFEKLDQHPRYAGEFVWTGFDYIGEPTPYNQDQTNALNFQNPEDRAKAMEELQRLGNRAPSRSSYFGILDLCGFKKDRFYLYQSRWRPNEPMAHILPHWNWPERLGQNVPVHVYTNGDEAELFLNGSSLGVRRKGEPHAYRLVWDEVTYTPGTLRVVVKKDGAPWSEAVMETTGPVARIEVLTDRQEIQADGRDLTYLTLRAVDAEGRLVPRTRLPVNVTASGPFDLVGICNGDPTDHTTMKPADPATATLQVFNGLAQVIVRSQRGTHGNGAVSVMGKGLAPAAVQLKSAD